MERTFPNGRAGITTLLAAAALCIAPLPSFSQTRNEIPDLVDLGIRYELESKYDQAIETFRKVLELDDSNSLAKIHLAKLLSWRNQFDEALVLLDEVIARDPDQLEALFRKAQILSWQKKYEESIDTYLEFLSHKPKDTLGLVGLGRVYFWSGRYGDALNRFEEALDAGADEVEVRLELGKVYIAMEDKEKARAEFEAVLEADPGNAEAKRFLEGIPKLKELEASIAGTTVNVYPDDSTGFVFTSFLLFHHKQRWDLTIRIDDEAVDEVYDQTVSFNYVYMGIPRLYLACGAAVTPDADYSPSYGGELAANYSLKNGLGFGLGVSAEVYQDAPLGAVQNDTLFTLKPEIAKYFGDFGYTLLRYNQYIYTSGFVTESVALSVSIAYLRKNSLYGSVTYGGDVETRVPDRRVFEFGIGIFQYIYRGLALSLNYSRVETQFGQTHQINITPLFQW